MEQVVVIVHGIVAVIIIGLVLLQQGKGADAGASFGSGASQTVFGSSGSGSFLVKATTAAAVVFFVTSLSLALFAKNNAGINSTEGLPIENLELLEQAAANSSAADVPQLDAQLAPQNTTDDVPSLPVNDN